MDLNNKINYSETIEEWIDVYKTLTFWELELCEIGEQDIYEILLSQKKQANKLYSNFIEKNYKDLIHTSNYLSSINLFKKKK